MDLDKPIALGIDIGSSKIVIAICENDKANVVLAVDGDRITPFCVAFNHKERLVSNAAVNQATVNPANTINGKDVLRVIGRSINDIKHESLLIELKERKLKNDVVFSVNYKNSTIDISPEQALSMVLDKATEHLKLQFNQKDFPVVVNVPSMFNSSQRSAIKNACAASGLNILGLLNSITASAITYNLEHSNGDDKNILIFDMGSTTLDVGIFEIRGNKVIAKSIGGDLNLGGDNFVEILVEYFKIDVENKFHVNIKEDKMAVARLHNGCEKIKKILSTSKTASHVIDTFYDGASYELKLTRDEFEKKCCGLFKKIQNIVIETIGQSGIDINNIDEYITIGKGGIIPNVGELLKQIFKGRNVSKILNPDESVAYGAAYLASNKAIVSKSYKVRKLDVQNVACIPITVQLGWFGASEAIKKNECLPFQYNHTFLPYKIQLFKFYEGESILFEVMYDCNSIEIFIKVDSDGLLEIYCKIISNGQEFLKKLINNTQFDFDKISELMKQAETFKHDEKVLKWHLQLRNDLEGACFKYKRSVESSELKSFIDKMDKELIITDCDDILTQLDDELISTENLKNYQDHIDNVCQPVIKGAKIKNLMEKAKTEKKKKQFDEACKTCTEAIDLIINDDNLNKLAVLKNFYKQRRDILFTLKKFQEAIFDCNEIIKMNADDLETYVIRGKSHFNLKQYEKCVKDLKQVLSWESNEELQKMYDEAENNMLKQMIDEALKKHETFCKQNKFKEASNVISDLLNQEPILNNEKYNKLLQNLYLQRVKILHKSKNYNEAIRECNNAVEGSMYTPDFFEIRALCYYELEQYEKALEDFNVVMHENRTLIKASSTKFKHAEKMIQLEDAKIQLAQCDEFLNSKCYQEAINILDQIEYKILNQELKLEYINKQIHAYYELKKFDDVLNCCDSALQLSRRYDFAYSMMAVVYVHQKKYSEAVERCKLAIKFNPNVNLIDFKQIIEELQRGEKLFNFNFSWSWLFTSFTKNPTADEVHPKIRELLMKLKSTYNSFNATNVDDDNKDDNNENNENADSNAGIPGYQKPTEASKSKEQPKKASSSIDYTDNLHPPKNNGKNKGHNSSKNIKKK